MRKAFTLIELLVVVSVIALLIAILLPALWSAKMSAQRTRESSDSASLVQSCISFAIDRDGVIPVGQKGINSYHMTWSNKPQWDILVEDYGLPTEDNTRFFGCSSWADLSPNPFYKYKAANDDYKVPYIYWGGFEDNPDYRFIRQLDDAPLATSPTLTVCFHNRQPAGTGWDSFAPHQAEAMDIGIVHESGATFDASPPEQMCAGMIDGSVQWTDFDDMVEFQSGSASSFWYAPR